MATRLRPGGLARLALVGALCALLVGGVYGVARQARSAGGSSTVDRIAHPAMTADAVCTTWATWWQSGSTLQVPGEALEAISRCRESVDGGWVVVDGIDDPALLRAPVASGAFDSAATRAAMTVQLAAFEDALSLRVRQALATVYVEEPTGVLGFVAEGSWHGGARELYEDAVVATLADPQFVDLRAYVAWVNAEREAGLATLLAACGEPQFAWLQFACAGLRRDLAIGATPWPWDLAEPWLLDRYLLASATGD